MVDNKSIMFSDQQGLTLSTSQAITNGCATVCTFRVTHHVILFGSVDSKYKVLY